MSETVTEVSGFEAMGLDPRILAALGYKDPSPIQREAIPVLMNGKDIVGLAGTGTGKTAAFALPILHRLRQAEERKPGVAVLILTPTRELAIQVARAVKTYGKPIKIDVMAVYGGTGYADQIKAIQRGVEIIVATPGRALDLIRQNKLSLDSLTTVVLDEADEMLNMGFAEDLEAILAVTPKHRQTMLFSATMPPRIEEIAQKHLRKPVRIKVAREEPEQGEAAKVRQTAYLVNREHKAKALARVLEIERPTSAIVFCRTRSDADSLLEVLTNSGFKPLALHGGLTQHQRDQVMGRFRSGSSDLLVATDIAARGLDIAHLSHVINFDLPSDPDQYVHRIGRVGRAGRAGVAITIATPREQFVLGQIERATRQKITIAPVPTAHDLQNSQLDRLRQRLRDSLANTDDADGLKAIVDELASEFSAVDVAVAALRLLHQPVQIDPGSDFATLQPSPREGRRDRGEGRPDRGERRPERGDRPRPGRSAVEERSRAGRKPTGRGMAKLYFGIGRDAGVAPRDLVGAIANEAGVSGRDIGTIDMTDRFSLVEVPVNLADFILEAMQGVRIRGRTVKVRADRPPL